MCAASDGSSVTQRTGIVVNLNRVARTAAFVAPFLVRWLFNDALLGAAQASARCASILHFLHPGWGGQSARRRGRPPTHPLRAPRSDDDRAKEGAPVVRSRLRPARSIAEQTRYPEC